MTAGPPVMAVRSPPNRFQDANSCPLSPPRSRLDAVTLQHCEACHRPLQEDATRYCDSLCRRAYAKAIEYMVDPLVMVLCLTRGTCAICGDPCAPAMTVRPEWLTMTTKRDGSVMCSATDATAGLECSEMTLSVCGLLPATLRHIDGAGDGLSRPSGCACRGANYAKHAPP
jgi:hypothetical protein